MCTCGPRHWAENRRRSSRHKLTVGFTRATRIVRTQFIYHRVRCVHDTRRCLRPALVSIGNCARYECDICEHSFICYYWEERAHNAQNSRKARVYLAINCRAAVKSLLSAFINWARAFEWFMLVGVRVVCCPPFRMQTHTCVEFMTRKWWGHQFSDGFLFIFFSKLVQQFICCLRLYEKYKAVIRGGEFIIIITNDKN